MDRAAESLQDKTVNHEEHENNSNSFKKLLTAKIAKKIRKARKENQGSSSRTSRSFLAIFAVKSLFRGLPMLLTVGAQFHAFERAARLSQTQFKLTLGGNR